MLRLLAISLMGLSLAVLGQPVATQEEPKWFVLRDHQIASFWTALLIKVDGIYRHGVAQTAGGPYDTEEQALQRHNALRQAGTCRERETGGSP